MKIFRSKPFLFILGIVIAACVIMGGVYAFGGPNMLSGVMGAVVTPLEKGVNAVTDWASGIFGYFYRYSSLQEENARLKEELADLRNQQREYLEALSENADLREMLGLKQKHREFDLEYCSIVSASEGSYRSVFTIDKGSVNGIEVGDCVVVSEGMVGYVSEVGPNYSEVLTVLDISTHVGAVLSRTRETAVSEGSLELLSDGHFKLSYLQNDADVEPGDLVETSGYGGLYPQGLLLGTVVEFLPESHGISSYAVVEPVVPLEELKSVFVVKSFEVVR